MLAFMLRVATYLMLTSHIHVDIHSEMLNKFLIVYITNFFTHVAKVMQIMVLSQNTTYNLYFLCLNKVRLSGRATPVLTAALLL